MDRGMRLVIVTSIPRRSPHLPGDDALGMLAPLRMLGLLLHQTLQPANSSFKQLLQATSMQLLE